MYEAFVEIMLIISQNRDRTWNTCAEYASSFWSLLLHFTFVFTLTVVQNCLGYAHSATEQLQCPQGEIVKGLHMIKGQLKCKTKFLSKQIFGISMENNKFLSHLLSCLTRLLLSF